MAYRVSTESRGGGKVYTLHDDASGSVGVDLALLRIQPVRLAAAGGRSGSPGDRVGAKLGRSTEEPSPQQVPILFPYPNRVRDAAYQFQGKSYRLPVGLAPNAITASRSMPLGP